MGLAPYRLHRRRFVLGLPASLAGLPTPAKAGESLVFSRQVGTFDDIGERILVEAYRRLGIAVSTSVMPGERGLLSADRGLTDGELNRIAGIEKDYPNLLRVPVPLTAIEAMAVVKAAPLRVQGWESLRPYLIGIRIGTKFAERGTQGMRVKPVAQYKELLRMLSRNRLEVVVASRQTVEGVFKEMRADGDAEALEGLSVLEPPIEVIHTYHYLNKKHAALLPDITRTLKAMAAEGRIQAAREQRP